MSVWATTSTTTVSGRRKASWTRFIGPETAGFSNSSRRKEQLRAVHDQAFEAYVFSRGVMINGWQLCPNSKRAANGHLQQTLAATCPHLCAPTQRLDLRCLSHRSALRQGHARAQTFPKTAARPGGRGRGSRPVPPPLVEEFACPRVPDVGMSFRCLAK